jgi:hypothetical protein
MTSRASSVRRRFSAAGRVHREEVEVARQRADADAEHVAAARQVIEVRDAVRELHRMVVRQQVGAGTELDALGREQRLRDQEIGRRTRLPGRREMLADPRLREAERVEPAQLREVPCDPVEQRPLRRMRRHHERTEPHGK